jgi:hypothetical protein
MPKLTIHRSGCDEGIDDNCGDYYYNSPWDVYGRWILLGAVIIGAFLIFLIFSCINARRRKRAGMQPLRGTGWASRPVYGWGQPQYTGAPSQQQPYGYNASNNYQTGGPPPYQAATEGVYGKPSQDPYAGPQPGVELQEPSGSYQRGGDNVYSGQPAAKDGFVR